MNHFISKLERKFGRFAIHNLSLLLILCYGAGYLIEILNPAFFNYLTLNPYQILHGQVWRIVTWIMIPPGSLDFFTLIMLYFYYSIGTNLERTWGAFRYNLYLFSGMLFTILGSFVLYGILNITNAEIIKQVGGTAIYFTNNFMGGFFFLMFSTYYVNMSIFLAYAATFPNMQVLLMFIIPIKVKVLGIIYAALLVYQFIAGNLAEKVIILASLLNFVVFFLATRNYKQISPKEIKRRKAFRRAVNSGVSGNTTSQGGKTVVTRHKCAICGRTELDDETLEFRFCSKCEGNYEYCMDHLYTHEHVHRG